MNDKISRLTSEKDSLVGEVREGQEKLRLSSNQTQKLLSEINDFKYKLTQFTTENEQLRKKLQETGDLNRKLAEYERRIEQLSGELRSEATKKEQATRENTTLSQRLI